LNIENKEAKLFGNMILFGVQKQLRHEELRHEQLRHEQLIFLKPLGGVQKALIKYL
jgi:hypothetical protein